MSGVRLGARSVALCLFLIAVPRVAAAAIPMESFRTNVRPFFGVGYSAPVHFDEFDRGFGLSFGFEAENSARASILFRFEWNRLRGDRPPISTYDSPYVEMTAVDWSLGTRVHLRTGGRFRPYTEGCLGVRLVGGERRPAARPVCRTAA